MEIDHKLAATLLIWHDKCMFSKYSLGRLKTDKDVRNAIRNAAVELTHARLSELHEYLFDDDGGDERLVFRLAVAAQLEERFPAGLP